MTLWLYFNSSFSDISFKYLLIVVILNIRTIPYKTSPNFSIWNIFCSSPNGDENFVENKALFNYSNLSEGSESVKPSSMAVSEYHFLLLVGNKVKVCLYLSLIIHIYLLEIYMLVMSNTFLWLLLETTIMYQKVSLYIWMRFISVIDLFSEIGTYFIGCKQNQWANHRGTSVWADIRIRFKGRNWVMQWCHCWIVLCIWPDLYFSGLFSWRIPWFQL